MDAYIRAVAFLSRVAGVVAAFLIFFAVLVICDIVVERYILNLTTIWQIDVVTYCIVGATFVGSAYVLMTRGHVNVDILPLHVKPRTRFWLALATGFLSLAFCIVIFVLCTAYWWEAFSRSVAVEHRVAGKALDSVSFDAGRARPAYPAICGRYLCVVTGRAPPFGIQDKQDAEDVARAQAREALGDAP